VSLNLDPRIVRALWPRAPQTKIDKICAMSAATFAEFGYKTWDEVAELMGNISHENGAGTIVRESGAYREEQINKIFGPARSSAKVTPEEARQLAALPVSQRGPALFERVYNLPNSPKLAKDLGNHEPGDGWKYRGGGDLQLTGRAAYEKIGKLTGYPQIIDNPDLLENPEISFKVACAEFAALGCLKMLRAGQSTEAVRIRVNGGRNGLHEAVVWVSRWKTALPQIETPVEAPRGADTGSKSILSSKIVQGGIGTAATATISTVANVAKDANTVTEQVDVSSISDKLAKASDTITTVTIAKDNATAIVTQVKPLLGLAPNTWAAIAIFATFAAVCFGAWVIWERYKKKRDSGE